MYYPIGWPRFLRLPSGSGKADESVVRHIVSNRDRRLFAVTTDDSIAIWFTKPIVPLVVCCRTVDSGADLGRNLFSIWRNDASMLAIVTSRGHLVFYRLGQDERSKTKLLYTQIDSKIQSLKRESAELFSKDEVPAVGLSRVIDVKVPGGITSAVGIRDELVVSTETGQIERYRWDGRIELDFCYDIAHIPFSVDQQNSRAIPLEESGIHIVELEYSPTLGGFAIALSDGRGALVLVPYPRAEQNQVRGLWASDVHDVSCVAVNHKYLLVAYGRCNGQTVICHIDEVTGGLHISHSLVLGSRDYPDASCLGRVRCARWTPDSCAILVAWQNGGLGMWSVYGALLLCTLSWDYGSLTQDLTKNNPLIISTMDWGPEGYHLWLSTGTYPSDTSNSRNHLAVMQFMKSALAVNSCVSMLGHVVLQGDDRLYFNTGQQVTEVWKQRIRPTSMYEGDGFGEADHADPLLHRAPNLLLANKQWIIVMIPSAYTSTNWPIRYVAVDENGQYAAIAGRTGVAHCCLQTKKWKLFGNETQEKDFVVTGSLLWWKDHLLMGCFNIPDEKDEIRFYPRDSKLDNSFAHVTKVAAQVLLMNLYRNRLAVFSADNHIAIYGLAATEDRSVSLIKEQDIDISNLSVHPVCVSHVVLMSSRTERAANRKPSNEIQNVMVGVCGKVIMFQLTAAPSSPAANNVNNNNNNSGSGNVLVNKTPVYVNPTILASCVESIWVSGRSSREKKHLVEAVLFSCGSQGMKVWLPLFPREGEKPHNFISKWIMLPLNVSIYPLTVLFEDAVILGAENDTVLYPTDPGSLGSKHPFSIIERTSQVYLHHILRQLLRRNLGFHAWEIARSCVSLPYFPHSLELLLHEVLEEEATSKEPIPDALLPRVVEFIREFPVYLQTVVQCARKIEIALWPHLFATVGQPHHLFQECLQRQELATGASYLIILQNLESSSVSRQYATKLLDSALEAANWELCKDLVRFLRAIDPNDVESPPRSGFGGPSSTKYHMPPPSSPLAEDMTFVLGTVQVPRSRTFSMTNAPKSAEATGGGSCREAGVQIASDSNGIPVRRKSIQTTKDPMITAEQFFLDVILQRHARKLLSDGNLKDLGHFAAYLDFHLVTWLQKERNRAAKIDKFVSSLKKLHQSFEWPYPVPPHPVSYYLQRKDSAVSTCTLLTQEDDLQKRGGMDQTECQREETRDSGYVSHTGLDLRLLPRSYGNETSAFGQTLEAQLRPHTKGENDSIRTLDMSEESSLWGEGDQGGFLDENTWNTMALGSDFEQMSFELASKGPPQSEVQLRYLLHLMMEASCLEWAILISVVLRDAMAVIRIVNAARAADVSREMTTRLREGLNELENWADRECLGYKRFMQTIRSQSVVLSKLSCSKLRIRPPSPSSQLDSDSAPSTASGVPDSPSGETFARLELGGLTARATDHITCLAEGGDTDLTQGDNSEEQTKKSSSLGMECVVS